MQEERRLAAAEPHLDLLFGRVSGGLWVPRWVSVSVRISVSVRVKVKSRWGVTWPRGELGGAGGSGATGPLGVWFGVRNEPPRVLLRKHGECERMRV